MPIAILCPPNFPTYVSQFITASCKLNPGMLLPEPFPSSPSKQIKMLGLKYISVTFDATIPITP